MVLAQNNPSALNGEFELGVLPSGLCHPRQKPQCDDDIHPPE